MVNSGLAWVKALTMGTLLCVASLASASPVPDARAGRLDACLQSAATYQRIDPALLKAIAVQESGMNPRAVNQNKNGSKDHGVFQINDTWLPTLKKFGITQADLYDPCVSAYVGAWVLAQAIAQHGPTWRAVGAYNAGNSPKREAARIRYAKTIMSQYVKIQK